MNRRDREGGDAFPWVDTDRGSFGMSMRDWFAGQALVGIGTWTPGSPTTLKERSDSQARHAYRVADAMLKAREET